MRAKEKLLKKCTNRQNKNAYFIDFKKAQLDFDKYFRLQKRKYLRGKLMNIDKIVTSNPNEFWKEIKKMGPKKQVKIPLQVYSENEGISNNLNTVLSRWQNDFANLYNVTSTEANNRTHDEVFLSKS